MEPFKSENFEFRRRNWNIICDYHGPATKSYTCVHLYTLPYPYWSFYTRLYGIHTTLDSSVSLSNIRRLHIHIDEDDRPSQPTGNNRLFSDVDILYIDGIVQNTSCSTIVADIEQLVTLSNVNRLYLDDYCYQLLDDILAVAPNIVHLDLADDLDEYLQILKGKQFQGVKKIKIDEDYD
ncbi:unnamed protein product [Didymodactylos carnosus]|uniref:Uncharacterized protein n=1 Tax=Didymodactylos carnosus TaxID=1234261 RepID=A0A815B826_9BILA|nr:unnamed protein product [Didymodactylos carnosus]CAF4049389.1 unnamed protein product [Didymodactylos carnosus]